MHQEHKEKTAWDNTSLMLGDSHFTFGKHWSFNFRNDPKRLGFVLSRYKFSAKMIGERSRVLELGCSDGIGITILSENTKTYTGVDLDREAIDAAKENVAGQECLLIHDDFMGKTYGTFDALVSLDVIEHIFPEYEEIYFETITQNLDENGICIIGTPNMSAAPYASRASELGHVNLYSQARLVEEMKKYFFQVFPFGMNDEVLHTGFSEMAHYLICVGCHKK